MKYLLGLLVASCIVSLLVGRAVSNPFSRNRKEQAETDSLVQRWLEALQRGSDGQEFWLDKDWVKPVYLCAVSEYTVVNTVLPNLRVIRIHSSTRSGTPVVRLWRVEIEEGKIASVEPVEDAIIQKAKRLSQRSDFIKIAGDE